MLWQTVLKAIPQEKSFFAITIVNAASTARLIKRIEEADLTDDKTKERFDYLKGLLISIEGGNPSLEDIIAPYSNSPVADLELSQIEENITKLKDALTFMTTADVKAKVEEGLEAKTKGNNQLVEEILQEIDKKGHLSERTLRTNKELRTKLEILRLKADKPYLSFEGLPENSKLIEQFAKLIGGEAKGDIILVDYTSRNDFIRALNPKIDKKTGAILDTPEIVAEKKEIKEFYNKNLKNSKWKLHAGGNVIDADDLVAQGKLFIASNIKLSVVEPFDESSVIKYIKAVDNITGSVRAFRPKKYPNTADTAKVLFLEKSSPNSMNLNPYSELILLGDYGGETWFKTFFNALRQTQMLSNKEAQTKIIDDIYVSMKTDKKSDYFREGQIDSMKNIINNIMGDFRTSSDSSVKSKIIEIIDTNYNLGDQLSRAKDELQAGQLQYLKGNFTIKEATDFEEFYSQLDKEEYPEDELEIEYFRDGFPTGETVNEIDSEGNVKRDEKGSTITRYDKGKERANYAKVTLDGDELTPESAYEFGLKVTTPEASTRKERGQRELEAKEKELIAAKKKLATLPKEGKEIGTKRVEKLERLIDEIKERMESGISPKDIGEKTQSLRQGLLDSSTFSKYVLGMAKKLKDEGGLTKLVEKIDNSAAALDQITPERSLGFFSQMADLTSNGEVSEAFKAIDKDPDSDNAIKVADQLNDNMPSLIDKMKKETVGAFRIKLEEFATKPYNFPPNQIVNAKKQFVEKYGLLRVGE